MPFPFGEDLANVTRDLEAIKLSLVRMQPDDCEARESAQIAREISAIRLQLKRLEADREWVKSVAARATSSDP